MTQETFVIVGASLAGAKAAEELRDRGFDGRVVLIGSEPDRPYERPPLSKDYLRGESARDKVFVHEPGYYADQEIELLTGRTATRLDPAAAELTLDDGATVAYDKLLLTTGSEPRRLEAPGAELDGIHYLRTLPDCERLRQRLEAGGRAAVIGAGWIGSEVAASARQKGLEVTLIDPHALPNERIFGPEIGAFYRDVHARHGVELALGESVEAFAGGGGPGGPSGPAGPSGSAGPAGEVTTVRTSSGRTIACDFAVVGVGITPRTQLAAEAGLDTDDGIVVDASLRTSAPNVFAAGDVANAYHPFYGRRIRVEHWANALNQGPAAARAMLGDPVSFDRLPYFFSDQYDVGMEYSGFAPEWDEVVFRGDRDGGEFVAFWLHHGRVVAGMNVNVWDVNEQVQALIRSRREVPVDALTDPDTPLETLAQ